MSSRKPLGSAPEDTKHGGEDGPERREAAKVFVRNADLVDPKTPYLSKEAFAVRMKARASLASLHSHNKPCR
jgi:hypothetical protein